MTNIDTIQFTFQNKYQKLCYLFCLLSFFSTSVINAQDKPNIILIIADDLGVDVSNGYHNGALMPNTPNLDQLRSTGITFENVWSAPKCTPTRGAIMSGKYGIKTGVLGTPGNLDVSHTSIFKELENVTNGEYADALIGKWHLTQGGDLNHPNEHEMDYFTGSFEASVADYYNWERTENGSITTDTTYVTTALTNNSLDWINTQTDPWFLWLAHVAPHSPIHLPPDSLYTISPTGSNKRKYMAMIEGMDFEIGRLLNNIPDDVLSNTVIIYVGDNGTPESFLQDYPTGHGKSTLYQGGIRVPMIISGKGVSRMGERESALIQVADIYATILEIAGADLEGGLYNSLSFQHLLSNEIGETRDYNYSELESQGEGGFTIRNEQYKLIEFLDGTQEFYDLIVDSLEVNNLMSSNLTMDQLTVLTDLEAEATQIRTAWSCRDHIKNGDEEGIDCGGSFCDECETTSVEGLSKKDEILLFPNPVFNEITIQSKGENIQDIRIFNTLGELVYSMDNINITEKIIDVSFLAPQIYMVQITINENSELMKMIKF